MAGASGMPSIQVFPIIKEYQTRFFLVSFETDFVAVLRPIKEGMPKKQ